MYISTLVYIALASFLSISAGPINKNTLAKDIYARDVAVTATAEIYVKDKQKKGQKKFLIKPTSATSVVRKKRSFRLRKNTLNRQLSKSETLSHVEANKRELPYTNPHPSADDQGPLVSKISDPIKASSKQIIPTQQLRKQVAVKNEVAMNNADFDVNNYAFNNNDNNDDDSDGDEEDDDDITPTDSTDGAEQDASEDENAPTDTPDVTDGSAADVSSQNNDEGNIAGSDNNDNTNQAPEPPNLSYNDLNADPEDSDDSDDLAPTDSTEGEKKAIIVNHKPKRSETKNIVGDKRELNPSLPIENDSSQEDSELTKDFVELSKLEQDINTIAGDLSSKKRNDISKNRR